ncbi:hypothetical protein KJ885_02560 [Patescibacteria group bacterium]|nr:hypothetical protein [Patescibacteria group bacterium]
MNSLRAGASGLEASGSESWGVGFLNELLQRTKIAFDSLLKSQPTRVGMKYF